jgi:hypothetical protein
VTAWYEIGPEDVPGLEPDIVSAVEMLTAYGTQPLDSHRLLRSLEDGRDGLDLGESMSSPTVLAILRVARQTARELREDNP